MPDKRARGYQPSWRPRPPTVELLAAVDVILLRYRELLPMSLRQLFYALVSDGVLAKSERAYRRLGEVVGMGRRSGRIPWEAIRDDSGSCREPVPAFTGPDDRDILVDDETLFDFYDQRVPADVVSGAHFDS
ncbi:DUF3418 domain-containing protein, partial [Streptomyces sp. NPDC046465]|uniref:DUF3418 domain-containing protein n=1 Tax=Streptomyces sp. NPDC046465 TaxID=3155810 RepID=UPI0033F5E1CA